MFIEFDPAKDMANIAKHGVSLESAQDLEIVLSLPGLRFDDGEERYRAWGWLDGE